MGETTQREAPPEAEPSPGARRSLWKRIAWWRVLRAVLIGLAVSAGLAAIAVVLVVRHYEQGLPDVAQLRGGYEPPQVTRVLARDGTRLADLFTERRTLITLAELPDHVKLAFLAAEDAHFYEHEGLNYLGMLRAMVANLRAGRTRQGGSTITQQVVKNVLLEPERTYERKIRETILARRVEQQLGKDEIFSLYLNHIYLGHGRYGIEEAAKYHFGKKARDLSLAEAALLAGTVASPEKYSPRRAIDKALSRRRYVLGQMRDKGFITPALYEQTVSAPPPRPPPDAEADSELAPDVVAEVKRVLEVVVGERAAHRGGFTVTTTIDPAMQASARRALRESIDGWAKRQKLLPPYGVDKRRRWNLAATQGRPPSGRALLGVVEAVDDAQRTLTVRVGDVVGKVSLDHEERWNPQHLAPSAFTKPGATLRVLLEGDPETLPEEPVLRLELGPEGALVAIDPRSREIRALVGSYEQIAGGLDRASFSRRQPGSAFKAFVYGNALHSRRFTAASVLDLGPSKDGKLPQRRLSVRDALARSDNAAAELLLVEAGAPNAVSYANAAGIESPLKPDRSLALGSYEVRPRELANAYATFAAGGEWAPAVLVTKIESASGRVYELPPRVGARRVMSEAEAWLVTSLLTTVTTRGTAARAAVLGRPVAGKTGTTNQAKDAWFAGYSTEIVAAVWIGFDDPAPLGPGESGAVTALPAFIGFMKEAHQGRPVTGFPRPPGLVSAKIDPATGLLARPETKDAVEEWFLDGTAPTEQSPLDAGVEAGLEGGADDETRESSDAATTVPSAPPTSSAAAASSSGVLPAPPDPPADEPPPF